MKTKRNYWPLGIGLGAMLFIGVYAAFVVIACMHRSDLVSENYYEQELKFQTRIDSASRARHLSTQAAAMYDAATKRVTVTLPREHAGRNVSGEIVLYRPSAAGLDRRVALAPDSAGSQMVNVSDAPEGLWRIRIEWKLDGLDYYFDQKLVIGAVHVSRVAVQSKSERVN